MTCPSDPSSLAMADRAPGDRAGHLRTVRRSKCPSTFSMPPGVAARPPRRRASTPVHHHMTRGCAPADPPTVEEIVAVMRAAGETVHGQRLRAARGRDPADPARGGL